MTEFNKLVRDRIPEIIRTNGDEAITSVLSDDQYIEVTEEKAKGES